MMKTKLSDRKWIRSESLVFFILRLLELGGCLFFRGGGGGEGIRGVSFFILFYPHDLPSGPSDPQLNAREGRSPEFLEN